MSIATGSQFALRYIPEGTFGVTPTSPAWVTLPITATTLGTSKDAIEDDTLRPDRQVSDLRPGNQNPAGTFDANFEYESFDDMLEAVLMGSWAADVLTAGVTFRSFSFEKFYGNVATPEYHRFNGAVANTFSMTVAPNAMVTTTFDFICREQDSPSTSILPGATYPAPIENRPFDSFSGTISEGGSPIANVTEISLSLDNGYTPAFVIGSDLTIMPPDGKSRLTGTLTAFYESFALYEKFINETASELTFTLVDPAGNQYLFDLPNISYTSGNPDVSGDGPVTLPLEFTAIYSDADSSQIVITRTPI